MKKRSPTVVLFQIFGHVFANENVAGVAAIHHPLRHVEPGTREIGVTIYIYYPAHRTTVHSHPKW